MTRIGLLAGLAAIGSLAAASAAHAIPRTFVSAGGGGATCTRAAPCATFQAAHNAADAAGEINCVDSGEFGPVTITKSITIDCAGTLGAISHSSAGVTVATPGIVVRLRNLTIRGLVGSTTSRGVQFTNGAALFVENCIITNMGTSTTLANGISVFPADGVTLKLFVSDTVVGNNTGSGILVDPNGSGSARLVIDNVRAEKNGVQGIRTIGNTSTGPIVVHIRNSVVTGNGSDGIRSLTAAVGSISSITVDRSSSTLNGSHGIVSQGQGAFILVGRSTVMSNFIGTEAAMSGRIFSYQNNHLTGNVTDGVPTDLLTVK
jgi:parallel beta helix pectate lyase-like protein